MEKELLLFPPYNFVNSFYLLAFQRRTLELSYFPDRQFQSLENPSIDVSKLRKIRWSPDFEALYLWKGQSGPRNEPISFLEPQILSSELH